MISVRKLAFLIIIGISNSGCIEKHDQCYIVLTNTFIEFMELGLDRNVDNVNKELIQSKRDAIQKALLSCPSCNREVHLKMYPKMSETHLSILADNTDAVRDYLLKVRTCRDCTPEITEYFHFTSMYGTVRLLEMFINSGLIQDIDAVDEFGLTPLANSVTGIQISISKTKKLADLGAKINVISSSGLSPLFLAVSTNNIELVKFLLSRGALLSESDTEDFSILEFSKKEGYQEIYPLLESASEKEK